MARKDVLILIRRIFEYLPLHGKRDFAVKDLEVGGLFCLIWVGLVSLQCSLRDTGGVNQKK